MTTTILKAEENPEFSANAISCTNCAWRREGGITCDAFPNGIPGAILLGAFDHTAHYNDGVDNDEGLTFTHVDDI